MGNRLSPAVYAAAFILGLALLGYLTVGFDGALFSAAFVGGFVLWLFTTYRTPVAPAAVIVPYLLTVICFIVHVYEEYRAHSVAPVGVSGHADGFPHGPEVVMVFRPRLITTIFEGEALHKNTEAYPA